MLKLVAVSHRWRETLLAYTRFWRDFHIDDRIERKAAQQARPAEEGRAPAGEGTSPSSRGRPHPGPQPQGQGRVAGDPCLPLDFSRTLVPSSPPRSRPSEPSTCVLSPRPASTPFLFHPFQTTLPTLRTSSSADDHPPTTPAPSSPSSFTLQSSSRSASAAVESASSPPPSRLSTRSFSTFRISSSCSSSARPPGIRIQMDDLRLSVNLVLP